MHKASRKEDNEIVLKHDIFTIINFNLRHSCDKCYKNQTQINELLSKQMFFTEKNSEVSEHNKFIIYQQIVESFYAYTLIQKNVHLII